MSGVLIKRGNWDTERPPCYDGSRNQDDATEAKITKDSSKPQCQEGLEQILPHSAQKEPILSTPWSQTSNLWKCCWRRGELVV